MKKLMNKKNTTAVVIVLACIIGTLVGITAMNIDEIKNFISLVPAEAKIDIPAMIALFAWAWISSPGGKKKNVHLDDLYVRIMIAQTKRMGDKTGRKYGTVKRNPVDTGVKADSKKLLEEASVQS